MGNPVMSPNADQTSVAIKGLTTQEAEARLAQFGPNEPAATQHHSFLSDLWHVFRNPLALILVLAAVASAFLGQAVDAGIIATVVLLSAVIDLVQTHRSQKAVEQLRERVAPTATVLRGGEWKEIQRREVVPGDIVRLSAGDLVPGDARLLVARDLYVQQAARFDESGCAQHGLSGNVNRQRNGDSRGRRHRRPYCVWRYCGPSRSTTGRDGLRSRLEEFQPTSRAHGFVSRSLSACRQHCSPPRPAPIVAVRCCARSRLNAGVPTDDYVGDALERRRRHGQEESHRQASLRH